MARGLRPGHVLQRDLVQRGTWIPMLKAGTELTPDLIAKIRRLGLEGRALECVSRERLDHLPDPDLLTPGDVARIDAILHGVSSQHELRQFIHELTRRMDSLSSVPDFRAAGPYDETHAINVLTLSLAIGRAMALGPAQLVSLGTGALLHDLGEAAVPEILVRQGENQTTLPDPVRHHPVLGVALLTRTNRFGRWLLGPEALDIVHHHHERMDGSGYPKGLVGRQIPQMARIVAVAD
ncbi:MAG: HD domain-containing protein, partial [Cyanobacteria bacterium REEB65]|nr:HD domain-containing protein [Cyanobacteria bacterium REEB65]